MYHEGSRASEQTSYSFSLHEQLVYGYKKKPEACGSVEIVLEKGVCWDSWYVARMCVHSAQHTDTQAMRDFFLNICPKEDTSSPAYSTLPTSKAGSPGKRNQIKNGHPFGETTMIPNESP